MNLTLAEQERIAYQRGDYKQAQLLEAAIDAEETAEQLEDSRWKIELIAKLFTKPNSDWQKRKKPELLKMLCEIESILEIES